MGLTPYRDTNDDYENPAILASHDNITWVVPNGAPDPLDLIVGSAWNADTELALNDGVLYCFWRYWDLTNGHLMMRTTTDGVHWTPKVQCDTGVGHNWTSPGIVVLNGVWHAWGGAAAAADGEPKRIIHLTAPAPTGPWSTVSYCTLNNLPDDRDPWHLDVVRHGGQWWMTISDGNRGSTGANGKLLLATSRDGDTWNVSERVMDVTGGWDGLIYRPTLIIDGRTARIWYGAQKDLLTWRIGYTEFPVKRFPAPPAA